MVEHAAKAIAKIRWSDAELREYVGTHLSEVKAHVFFDPPRRPLAPARFAAMAASRGLDLDPRSRLLFSGTMFFINGERAAIAARARPLVRQLADRRRLDAPLQAPAELLEVAYGWYLQGYLRLQGEET
jgi:50S ribosomal protein L16 3-hydroxylase